MIVNNASVVGWRAQEGQAHYAAAKAGVMALTRCSAIEAAPHNIRINAVSPSLAMHPFLAKVTTDKLLEELVTARGVRSSGRAVGGRERDRLPRQRLRQLHDRRGRLGQLPAPLIAAGGAVRGAPRRASLPSLDGTPGEPRSCSVRVRAGDRPRARDRDHRAAPSRTYRGRPARARAALDGPGDRGARRGRAPGPAGRRPRRAPGVDPAAGGVERGLARGAEHLRAPAGTDGRARAGRRSGVGAWAAVHRATASSDPERPLPHPHMESRGRIRQCPDGAEEESLS